MHPFITVLYTVAALLGASFAVAEFRLIVRFLRNRRAALAVVQGGGGGTGSREGPFPTVTIQLPLYNERLSARQVILAAAEQDYPRDRFDIQVLDDSTDETTALVREVVEEVRARGVRIEHLHRTNRAGFKAGALAAGLQESRADFVALFDADFRPPADFLRRVLNPQGAFKDADVAFVQTRWSLDQAIRGAFDAALSLFIDRHFYIQKPARAFAGQVTAFNGSAGIWRRAAIDAAGGWSADTLTEDLDLSYRCALAGWRGAYVHDVAVPNQLPGHMRSFKIQQLRWARGTAQCLRKLTGPVMDRRNSLKDRWEEFFLLAGYGVHPVILANLILWPWAVLYVDRTFFLVMQAVMSLATLAAPVGFVLTLRERGERLRPANLAQALVGLVLGMGLMVNNTVGQIQGLLSGQGEFARTPKVWRPHGGVSPSEPRPYHSPLHWTFYAELVVLAYCLAGSAILISRGEALWAFPLLFWGVCIGMVVQLQLAPQPA